MADAHRRKPVSDTSRIIRNIVQSELEAHLGAKVNNTLVQHIVNEVNSRVCEQREELEEAMAIDELARKLVAEAASE